MNQENVNSAQRRLIGWLVSYGLDENGKAFEIRSGRTLITSEKGHGFQISLNDETVSAPHAAVKASVSHKLVAADIFSKYGTYYQASSESEEQQISAPVELKHGDWIRIGQNLRLQVCLIDGPGKQ
jgi:hypothetical protein